MSRCVNPQLAGTLGFILGSMKRMLRFRRFFYFFGAVGALVLPFYFLITRYYHMEVARLTSKVLPWLTPQTTPPVFFIETSDQSQLPARVACAIEAAALHHPRSDVTLYSLNPPSLNNTYVKVLRNLNNIRFEHLKPEVHFAETPFQHWYSDGLLQRSKWPINQLSNALRLALLWKRGGIYLDTDVVALRALNDLRNALGLQDATDANNAVLVFDERSDFLFECMVDFVLNYDGSTWGHQGPALMTRVLKVFCRAQDLKMAVNGPGGCRGVTLLPLRAFYLVDYARWGQIFSRVDEVKFDLRDSYAVHLWAHNSWRGRAYPGKSSFLEDLVAGNCPSIYQIMKQNKFI